MIPMQLTYPIEGVVYLSAKSAAQYMGPGGWHSLTAGRALRLAALQAPNKGALVCDDVRVTYSDFDSDS